MSATLDKNTEQLNEMRESLVPVVTPWLRAYLECSNEVQAVVRELLEIISDDASEEDEKEMAITTLREALFPSSQNGALEADLEGLEDEWKTSPSEQSSRTIEQMDHEEATFADRVAAIMKSKGMTQEELAASIAVGQSAISMMLARKARPQKRTVVRIAEALGVPASDLWPENQEE